MTAADGSRRAVKAAWWTVAVMTAAATVVVSPTGADAFRLPKELILREASILAIFALAAYALLGNVRHLIANVPGHWIFWCGMALGWSAVAATFSRNRPVAFTSCAALVGDVLLFLFFIVFSRDISIWAASCVLVIPAVINALVAVLQTAGFYTFGTTIQRSDRVIGLLGNADDAGSYFALAMIVAAVLVIATGSRRMFFLIAFLILAGALLLTRTVTAIAAATVALACLPVVRSVRSAKVIVVALAVAIAVGIMAIPLLLVHPTLVNRWKLNAATSYRLTAFAAAYQMFCDRPLTGVGPGCFAWEYFDYKVLVEDRYPVLLDSPLRGTNFGEVHNDHLQLLAEGGLPALALFLMSTVLLVSCSWRYGGGGISFEERPLFVSLVALPLTAGVVVLMAGQFPWHLPATRAFLVSVCGMTISWSGRR